MTIKIEILEPSDILLETDYIRYTEISYEGQSDYVQTTGFGGSPINFFRWCNIVDVGFLFWINKPLSEFWKSYGRFTDVNYPSIEFARGNIPASMQLRIDKDDLCYDVVKLHRELWTSGYN